MSDMYVPPFTMTEEIVNMGIYIGELVGRIDAHDDLSLNPTLRRENRINLFDSIKSFMKFWTQLVQNL